MILEMLRKRAQSSDVCAVDIHDNRMTFKMLPERSDALASYFLKTLEPKAKVMILGDKENEYLTVMLACLKSGRAYVPLTSSLPKERALFILKDSEASLVISFSDGDLGQKEVPVIKESELLEIIYEYRKEKVSEESWLNYEEMMALLYTSGSTGNPKGVMNALGDLENLFLAPEEFYIGGHQEKVMNNFSYMFSAHMQHVYRTMVLMGSTLYAVPSEYQKDPGKLLNQYLKIQPEYLGLIATSCSMLLMDERFSASHLPQLKSIALAGEVCGKELVKEVFRRFPKITVKIQYASTELTTVAIGCTLTKDAVDELIEERIPLGKAVPSIDAVLVDEEGNLVPEGEKGELVIFSRRLCDGYYKLEEETKRTFFVTDSGRRGFRTKDLMIKKEGLYYYLGRLDNRVKIGGNRVELEEVESALNREEWIHQSVVRPVVDKEGAVKFLVAYVTLTSTYENRSKLFLDIRKGLKERLPSYMIPQKIIGMDVFPQNSSGKIDRFAMRLHHEALYSYGK